MGKTTDHKCVSFTPNPSKTPVASKLIMKPELKKISKSTPRQPLKGNPTIKYIREAAAAMVSSSQGQKSRPLILSASKSSTSDLANHDGRKAYYEVNPLFMSTPSKMTSRSSLLRRSTGSQTNTPFKEAKKEVSPAQPERRRSTRLSKENKEDTFTIENHQEDRVQQKETKSPAKATIKKDKSLSRRDTFLIQSSLTGSSNTRDASCDPSNNRGMTSKSSRHYSRETNKHASSRPEKGVTVGMGGINIGPGICGSCTTSIRIAVNLDDLVNPIMTLMRMMEEQHEECVNKVLKSYLVTSLQKEGRLSRNYTDETEEDSRIGACLKVLMEDLTEMGHERVENVLQEKRNQITGFFRKELRRK